MVNLIKTSAFTLLRFSGYLGAAIVFYTHTLQGNQLEPGAAFSTLATLNFLGFYVCLFMGYGITTLAEFLALLQRTTRILLLNEKTSPFY